jgi:chromosome segregation ATPase
MIDKTIGEIEVKLRGAEGLAEERKRELLQLVATLKTEAAKLKQTQDATREKQKSLKYSVDELRSSVEGFEKDHPKLVQLVNSISNTLSNLGI